MWIISGKYYLLTICYRLTALFLRSTQDRKRTDPETKELDNLYALHTDLSHSDRVRRSELVRHLFLNYLEVRLVDRVRQNLHRLSRTFADEESRVLLLSDLQYQRNYLSSVSRELGRR